MLRDLRLAGSIEREMTMARKQKRKARQPSPSGTRHYLAQRLDGARDLYLLALALGERGIAPEAFGRMIREARVHFAAVIEECRIAGLETGAIARMLGKMYPELADSMKPEVWKRVEQIIARASPRTRR
jgi:hypothetical protein